MQTLGLLDEQGFKLVCCVQTWPDFALKESKNKIDCLFAYPQAGLALNLKSK